jgi:hypothetical protein
MPILVSDTSVLIDIERADLTARLFALPHEFVVPDLLYDRELAPHDGADLVARGLRIEDLSGAEVQTAAHVRRENGALSLPDAYAFSLAQGRGWTLLTGDGLLRALAQRAQMPMHGVLWLFDEMEVHEVCSAGDLHTGLTTLSEHPRCRLPRVEMNARLRRYRSTGEH